MADTSRAEAILEALETGETYNGLPQSRMEKLLLDLDTGGGGGTLDYNKLNNRPYTASGRPLEGDITDEVEESTPAFTEEQVAELKKRINK